MNGIVAQGDKLRDGQLGGACSKLPLTYRYKYISYFAYMF